jgi:hypothetical protein
VDDPKDPSSIGVKPDSLPSMGISSAGGGGGGGGGGAGAGSSVRVRVFLGGLSSPSSRLRLSSDDESFGKASSAAAAPFLMANASSESVPPSLTGVAGVFIFSVPLPSPRAVFDFSRSSFFLTALSKKSLT